jgi:hypothetical protein
VDLPITIVIEPPSLVALRALLRCRWLWVAAPGVLAVAVGALVLALNVSRAEALAPSTSIDLQIASRPDGAEVWIDDHATGRTPAVIGVAPGAHHVVLRAPGAVEAGYRVDAQPPGVTLDATLWRRQPRVTLLRPALPGARLGTARLLPDGRIALGLSLGAESELQAWRLDPLSSELDLVQSSLPGRALAMAPRSQRVAAIGRSIGPPRSSSVLWSVVWLSEIAQPSAPRQALWQAPAGDVLTDLVWTPDEHALLTMTEQESPLGGDVRTRLWLIDLDGGGARLLFSLPSHLVPGAYVWRPDGRQVALLAHSGRLNALCLLDLEGEFRYLADLEPSTALPLPYPPVAWSADSPRLAFAAPRQEPAALPATWLQAQSRRVAYVLDPGGVTPRLLAETDAQAVAWREDGQLLALSRGRENTLAVVMIDAAGREERLLELAGRSSDAYAAEWDIPHAQLLLAAANGGEVEYWLARFALGNRP